MKLHHIIISIIVVSIIALSVTTYITDLGDNYGETADFSQLNNTKKAMDQQINNSQILSDRISDLKLETGTDFIIIPYKLIQVGWTIARTMFGSWGVIQSILADLGNSLAAAGIPLPSWLIASVMSIFMFFVIAIILYAFFKWKFED